MAGVRTRSWALRALTALLALALPGLARAQYPAPVLERPLWRLPRRRISPKASASTTPSARSATGLTAAAATGRRC